MFVLHYQLLSPKAQMPPMTNSESITRQASETHLKSPAPPKGKMPSTGLTDTFLSYLPFDCQRHQTQKIQTEIAEKLRAEFTNLLWLCVKVSAPLTIPRAKVKGGFTKCSQ
jgi:hypothetical protein